MTILICPRCNAVRQTDSTAPDWQCPSCGKAYPQVGSTESKWQESPRRPVAHVKPNSSSWLKPLLLVALLTTGGWFTKSIWLKAAKPPVVAVAEQPAVTLYATSWCGYCAATREFFETNGIQYTELDVEKTTAGYEGHKKLGGGGIPVIVIGNDVQRGYSEQNLRAALKPWLKS
jgi:glutaredoxin